MRNWLNDARSYIEPIEIGAVMRALGIGRVVESRSDKFKAGDLVSASHKASCPVRSVPLRLFEEGRCGVGSNTFVGRVVMSDGAGYGS